jgi:hypothetical protein
MTTEEREWANARTGRCIGEKGEDFYRYDPHGRFFDCASCDKAARGSAQDDGFVIDQIR